MDIENQYGTLNAQKGLLELLKAFHSFCIQNGIFYSLAYGSLLGAIRHQGFIPWDDDLDVFVDRENYNKLVVSLKDNHILSIDRESLDSRWVDRVRMKTKILNNYSPTLDILVLDNVPDNIIKKRLKLFLVLMLQGMIKPRVHLEKGSLIMKISSITTFVLGRFFPLNLKRRWYRRVSQIGNTKPSKLVANYNGEFSDLKRCYPYDMMNHIIDCKFEDTKAYIVEDYDMCLTIEFGDYMTPPKESERRPNHGGGDSC